MGWFSLNKESWAKWRWKKEALVGMDVNADGNEKDGDDTKIYDGMNQNREAACMHVSKLHHSTSSRQLKQKPRRQQHKQHHRYQHWSPICHLSPRSLCICMQGLASNLWCTLISLSLSRICIYKGVWCDSSSSKEYNRAFFSWTRNIVTRKTSDRCKDCEIDRCTTLLWILHVSCHVAASF